MASVQEVLKKLKAKAKPDHLEGMARYGMAVEKRLGVAVPEMRKIAKETGKDHRLALELWQTGIAEAMMVASMVDVPEEVTEEQMEEWVQDFNSWDVCDQVCMNLFKKTPLAWKKIQEWSKRDEEFVKRAAFALIACLAWHKKETPDEKFIKLIPVIKQGVTDERNYVKKAVSWALRNIGKRNPKLNKVALEAAKEMQKIDAKPAKWIAADTVRDLASAATEKRLKQKTNSNKKPGNKSSG
ncbi:MAG: DNA alkylation repair protein [candidate division KSB1 bacterium]|nr:DNA alkylation repair protein [candidate division KSB1 bacterium]